MTHSITSKYNYDVVIKYSEEVKSRFAQRRSCSFALHLLFFVFINLRTVIKNEKILGDFFFSYQAFPRLS
jgi:hypothetical protein